MIEQNNRCMSTKMLGVGTATPPTAYTQHEVLDLIQATDRRTRAMFLASAIETRYLTLPQPQEDGEQPQETQGDLLQKHRSMAIKVGSEAVMRCLDNIGCQLSDIDSLCCVTSTGLLTPGLSALLCQALSLKADCNRLDVVGMGCNAGLNGLNATTQWATSHPGKLSLMVCIEMCSAAYVSDGSIETSVVNSLFGDGASAVAVRCDEQPTNALTPSVLHFTSHIVTDAIDAMKFNWDDQFGKFSFFLAKDVPYVVGSNIETAVHRLLTKSGRRKSDIDHWVIHSGGKKVIDSIKVNLGLTSHDVRHTVSVLRDYGNVSSGSFLFSFERLLAEQTTRSGDLCMMITMGPGTTIETALLQF